MKSGCFTVVAFGVEWKIEEKKTVFLSAGEATNDLEET